MPSGCGWFRRRNSKASACLGVTVGPGIGEEIAHVSAGGTGGELIEHVAEIRPRVETVPRRAGADAQQHGGGLQPAVATDCSQLARPIARGRMARSAAPLSIANLASSR